MFTRLTPPHTFLPVAPWSHSARKLPSRLACPAASVACGRDALPRQRPPLLPAQFPRLTSADATLMQSPIHPVLPVRPVRGSQLRRCTGALDPPSRIGPGSAGASIVIIVISTPLTIMWTLSPLVDSPGMMMQQSCPLRCGLHCLGMLVIAQDLPMHGMQCI